MKRALVIGGGPAGLMAADVMASGGLAVTLCDQMPTVGRKFLMAGKSGLNLTKDEPLDAFLAHYREPRLDAILRSFGPAEVQNWAQGLGQETFTGSSGRVFPTVMKASPLLRAWLSRLTDLGVQINTRWRWIGDTSFDTLDGVQTVEADVTVLAVGGASWKRLGSDGKWIHHLGNGHIAPFQPSNMGFQIQWSDHMSRHFGAPVKNLRLNAGDISVRGECVITRTGIEGGGIYAVSRLMRDGAILTLDLMPNLSVDDLRQRLSRPRGKASLTNHLRKVLKLEPAKLALLMEFARPLPDDMAPMIKALPIPHNGPNPMDQAISTTGGLRLSALDDHLMIRGSDGIFVAGEMINWDAPTGGYLLTACLATGCWAGSGALYWLNRAQ